MSLPPRRATPAPTRPATSTPPRLPHADTEGTDMTTHPDDPRRVAQDEEQAEARAEDLAWEHEQEMDRRVWDRCEP